MNSMTACSDPDKKQTTCAGIPESLVAEVLWFLLLRLRFRV